MLDAPLERASVTEEWPCGGGSIWKILIISPNELLVWGRLLIHGDGYTLLQDDMQLTGLRSATVDAEGQSP